MSIGTGLFEFFGMKHSVLSSVITSVSTLLFLGVLFGVSSHHTPNSVSPSSASAPSISAALTPPPAHISCHIRGVLPDPTCTPGSIDPHVTQDTIQQTICSSGYTKTVRPPTHLTNTLKQQQILAYGYQDTNPHDYEEDHLISLELGGNPTDPQNLWPEPGASPNPKDTIENVCHKKVCDGDLSLAVAQKEIATDWRTACQ